MFGNAIAKGDKIVLSYTPETEEEFRYAFADRNRKPLLFWLALAFAVAIAGLVVLLSVFAAYPMPSAQASPFSMRFQYMNGSPYRLSSHMS